MRMLKLALAAVAALMLGSASAHAITVKKRTEAPGLPAEVWAVASDFCAIKDWHPAVADCVLSDDGGNTVRTLTLKDNGGTIKEKLISKGDLSYTYEILESPLPIKNYKSKLWVEADDEPDRSVIYWQSDFDAAEGTSDEKAEEILTGILRDGVKGIKKQAIIAYDKREGITPSGDDADDDDDN